MTGIVNAAGYSSYWIEFAEAFCQGKISTLRIPAEKRKECDSLRYEYYVFRKAAEETYPELACVKACINQIDEGHWEIVFSNRDTSRESSMLKGALELAGVLQSPKQE